MAPRRDCLTCGTPVTRPGAVRCRACSNRAKAGTFTPESAKAAQERRDAIRTAERAELARLRAAASRRI